MVMQVVTLLLLAILIPVNVTAGGQLEFNDVVMTALRYAFDVRSSALDIMISRAALQEAKSFYYPELNARFNSQYARDLTGGTPQVTAIGTTVLLQNTAYQSSFSINASINLYDFGAREMKVLIADKDIQVKQEIFAQKIKDTKLKVLEVYRDLLLLSMELRSKKELLSLYKELSLTKERLFTAGKISKIEYLEEAIKVVKTLDAIDNLKLKFISALMDLSFSTGNKYDAEGLEVGGFKDQTMPSEGTIDIRKSSEFKIYELEIEKKKAELVSLKKERYLPSFSFYSNYIFYGEDRDKYWGSLGEMQSRNYFIGLQANLPLFDGFKSSAQIEKTKMEIDRLKVEQERKRMELFNRYEKLKETIKFLGTGLKNQEEITAQVNDHLSMMRRLTEQQISEQVDLLNRKIELVLQKFELEKMAVMRKAAAMEIRILTEDQN